MIEPSDGNEESRALLREAVDQLIERMGRIESRINRLEASTAGHWLETPREDPAPPPDASPKAPLPGAAAREEPVAAEVVADEGAAEPPARRAVSPEPFPLGKRPKPRAPIAWETAVGTQWMTWAGAVTLLVAIGFTIHWVWQTFETPAWLKVLGFHLLGLALLIAGYVLNRRDLRVFAHGLAGLGLFTLYAIAFAALHLYEMWGEQTAFVEAALITAVAIVTALRAGSPGIVLLGALGGYLTPALTSSGSDAHVALFVYLAFLNTALIGAAVLRPWSFLKPIALAATAIMFLLWIVSNHYQSAVAEKIWSTQWLLVLHGLIFLAGTTIPPLVWKRTSTEFDLAALVGSSLWFVGSTWLLFHDRPEQQLELVSWGMALLHLGLFGLTVRAVTNVDRMPRVQLALAATFVTLAAPLQLDDAVYLAAAWAVEGLIFTLVGVYFRDRQMNASALVVFLLAAVHLFVWEFDAPLEMIAGTSIDLRFVIFTVCGLCAMVAGAAYFLLPKALGHQRPLDESERSSGAVLLAAGNLVILLGLLRQWDESRWVLVLWTLDAALVWTLGFRFRQAGVRWYAALLAIGLVGGRMIYHLQQPLGEFALPLALNPRVGSLALVALLYFTFGWWYHRLRLAGETASGDPHGFWRDVHEDLLDPLFGILGNVALFMALSWQIQIWFDAYAPQSAMAVRDLRMAEQATYSVAWAIYAATLIVVGFALRYKLFRLLGMLCFLPILAKVFLIDLASLELFPRVLALAVLGLMLLGVSFLYQKFTARIAASGE